MPLGNHADTAKLLRNYLVDDMWFEHLERTQNGPDEMIVPLAFAL